MTAKSQTLRSSRPCAGGPAPCGGADWRATTRRVARLAPAFAVISPALLFAPKPGLACRPDPCFPLAEAPLLCRTGDRNKVSSSHLAPKAPPEGAKSAPWRKQALAMTTALWQKPRAPTVALPAARDFSCGSSVVEHSIGNGEVESSILSRSTIKTLDYARNPLTKPTFASVGGSSRAGFLMPYDKAARVAGHALCTRLFTGRNGASLAGGRSNHAD